MQRSVDMNDIRQALRPSQSHDALKRVQAKLSVKPGEAISPHDERLLLVKLWMDDDPAAEGLFSLWGQLRDMLAETTVISLLTSIVSLLGSQYIFHSYATPIIKKVVSYQWLRRLNQCLSGSHKEQILAVLNLFNAVSAFAGGQERRLVFEAFPWDKNPSKLLSMRRKEKNRNILLEPDIRTSYILLALSMIDRDTVSTVKIKFIEQCRETLSSIFRGLAQDPYSVVQHVLKVCWEGLWSDPKVKRTSKVAVFNEATILHIVKLYGRVATEMQEGEHVLADIAHHFLLAICTQPGHGICFRDRGWYPWAAHDGKFDDEQLEDHRPQRKGTHRGKLYNKILANILPKLKVVEDPRQQELALRILAACPELVSGYWSSSVPFEPSLSSAWIVNIMFVGQVISQPLPHSTFLLPGSNKVHMPIPPPISTIMANVLPPIGTRSVFTRGLQHSTSSIVRHCTALVLANCLRKLVEVVRTFKTIEVALEEDEAGPWCRRRKEVEAEARRRVPDFQVVIAFWQQTSTSPQAANFTTHALLSESSQRLLRLYQESLPDVVAEAKFEVGKLLGLIGDRTMNSDSISKGGHQQVAPSLQRVAHLHVLHTLCRSEQFASTAISSSPFLHLLLKSFCDAHSSTFRDMLRTLVQQILGDSVLFQEHPPDVGIWLAALPSGILSRAQDGTALTNEVDAVVSFLVDCIQRCLKTPYRYMEAPVTMDPLHPVPPIDPADICTFTSPLLVTVLEQVGARVNTRSQMPSSDMLAIFTFIRRLLVMLASKLDEYTHLSVILDRLEESVADGQSLAESPDILFAIRRELSIVRACLCHLEDGSSFTNEEATSESFSALLYRIEHTPVPESEPARIAAASELIDQLRSVNTKLSSSDFARLVAAVQRCYEPATWALVDHVHPQSGYLWESGISTLVLESSWLPMEGMFGWLYLQSTPQQLEDRRIRESLLMVLYSGLVTFSHVERAMRLVIHGIGVSVGRHDLTAALLSLLSGILVRAKGRLGKEELRELKAHVVVDATIQGLCTADGLSTELREATHALVVASFDPMDIEDRRVLVSMISHWAARMKVSLESGRFEDRRQWNYIQPWVKFMENEELLVAVELVATSPAAGLLPASEFLDSVLSVLNQREVQLSVPKLLELQESFPDSALLEKMLSSTLRSQLPCGFSGEVIFSREHWLSELLCDVQVSLAQAGSKFPSDLVSRFLDRETWNSFTSESVITMLYADATAARAYATWLRGSPWLRHPPALLASTLAAFLDCTSISGGDLSDLEDGVLVDLLDKLFGWCSGLGDARPLRVRCLECICRILKFEGDRRPELVSHLVEDIERRPIVDSDLAFQSTFIARQVFGLPGCHVLVSTVIDRVLRWAVHHVSTGSVGWASEDAMDALLNLEHMARCRANVELKPHLVEPLLTAIMRTDLTNGMLLDLALALVDNTPFKALVVHRLLQAILQHPQFSSICGKDKPVSHHTKRQIARLLRSLFHLYPDETCQSSHIKPLVQIYGGTLSEVDRCLLSIFRLFEATKRTPLSTLFAGWSPSVESSTATHILEVVQGFDSVRIFQTCLAFPSWRYLDTEKDIEAGYTLGDDSLYDPVIVLVLTAQMLVEQPPATVVDWVKLFRSNVVSLLIRCLASRDDNVRQSALSQIARVWESLQNVDMQEARQVIYVLRLLRNIVPGQHTTHSGNRPIRLPTYTSLILVHALRGIFYPSTFMYPRTARFLLQRPELDVSDVPMLFGMLYSSTDDSKKERGFILRMLGEGMVSTADWRVLKRRHTWDLVASLFQSSQHEASVRAGILGLLANLACNAEACTSLVLKSSILSWIEMQVAVGDGPSKECIAWLRILENIILVGDVSKLNRALGGEWCSIICRILCAILRWQTKDTEALGILHQSGTVLLRLSLIQGVPDRSLRNALSRAVESLLSLESSIEIHHFHPSKQIMPSRSLPPHRAQGLQEMPLMEDPLQVWGEIVETLWRVGMSLRDKSHAWTVLTQRLLVWRALVGDEMCPMGEWVRKEVVRLGRRESGGTI